MIPQKRPRHTGLGSVVLSLTRATPHYFLREHNWQHRASSVPGAGPATWSLPWRAVSFSPSCRDLSLWLVSVHCSTPELVLSSRDKWRSSCQEDVCWGPFVASLSVTGPAVCFFICRGEHVIQHHDQLYIHSFWPPKKTEVKTRQPYLKKVVMWMI